MMLKKACNWCKGFNPETMGWEVRGVPWTSEEIAYQDKTIFISLSISCKRKLWGLISRVCKIFLLYLQNFVHYILFWVLKLRILLLHSYAKGRVVSKSFNILHLLNGRFIEFSKNIILQQILNCFWANISSEVCFFV